MMEAGPGQWQRKWRELQMVGLFAREMHRLSDGWNIENETEEIPRMVLRLHPQHRGEWRCHLLR